MRSTDDLNPERHYPLGAPIRPARDEGPEWVVDDPATPWIQRSLVTGKWRNIRPVPPPSYPSPFLENQNSSKPA